MVKRGLKKENPPHKKATKASQIKMSQNKGDKPNKGKLDTLLGDPMVSTKKSTIKAKEKGQKDTIGINDIGIFEFIFQGLPNPPDLEGADEDRLLVTKGCTRAIAQKRQRKRKKYYKKSTRV